MHFLCVFSKILQFLKEDLQNHVENSHCAWLRILNENWIAACYLKAPAVQVQEHAKAIMEDDLKQGIYREDPVLSRLARGLPQNSASCWQVLFSNNTAFCKLGLQRLGTGCFRHFCCCEVARWPTSDDGWCRQRLQPPHDPSRWLHSCFDQTQSPWSSAASCWCGIIEADPARVLAKVSPAVRFWPGSFWRLLGRWPIIGGAMQNTRGRRQKCLEPFYLPAFWYFCCFCCVFFNLWCGFIFVSIWGKKKSPIMLLSWQPVLGKGTSHQPPQPSDPRQSQQHLNLMGSAELSRFLLFAALKDQICSRKCLKNFCWIL